MCHLIILIFIKAYYIIPVFALDSYNSLFLLFNYLSLVVEVILFCGMWEAYMLRIIQIKRITICININSRVRFSKMSFVLRFCEDFLNCGDSGLCTNSSKGVKTIKQETRLFRFIISKGIICTFKSFNSFMFR